jgi:hypothetical protein
MYTYSMRAITAYTHAFTVKTGPAWILAHRYAGAKLSLCPYQAHGPVVGRRWAVPDVLWVPQPIAEPRGMHQSTHSVLPCMHGRILSPSGSCQGNWKLRENRILVLGLLGRGSRKLGRENKRRKGDNRRKINTNIA